jgi:hypothetical protein
MVHPQTNDHITDVLIAHPKSHTWRKPPHGLKIVFVSRRHNSLLWWKSGSKPMYRDQLRCFILVPQHWSAVCSVQLMQRHGARGRTHLNPHRAATDESWC